MVNYVYIGIIAVVIVLLIIGALDRWNVFGDDREKENDGTDRVNEEYRRENFDVALLKKHKTLTLPAKVVVVCLGLIVLATSVYAYLTLKNGAPVEVPYANAMQASVIAIVGIGGGVTYRAKKDQQRGRIDVIFEDDDGGEDATETIWYIPSEATRNKEGKLIVKEHHPTRILGLFGRRKLVAHDRELRSERAILSDVVSHEIPDHAAKLDEHHYQIRTQERIVTNGVSTAADYQYRSPIELPYQTYLQQKEEVEKYKSRLDTKDAILGETQTQLRQIRRRLETQDYRSREEALDEIMDVIDRLPTGQKSVEIRSDNRPQRMPEDQRDLAKGEGDD